VSNMVPYIPDNAPFTPEQRGWLNGFLAGLFSAVPGPGLGTAAPVLAAVPDAAPMKISVLHASQSGTGEGLARKLAKQLKAKGFVPTIASLANFTPEALAAEEHAVIIASTYLGFPPDAVKSFFQQLTSEGAPKLEKLHYSLLALGDRHYETFCKFGADLDERLQALGAQRIVERVESDLDVDEPFARFKAGLLERLEALKSGGGGAQNGTKNGTGNGANGHVFGDGHFLQNGHSLSSVSSVLAGPPAATREEPFFAPLVDKRPLTSEASSKVTLHLAFSLKDAEEAGRGMAYEAGDALGVVAQNDPGLVGEVLEAAGLTGSERVALAKLPDMPLIEALTHHLQITRLTRKIVDAFATRAECATLKGLLVAEQQTHFDAYCYDRGLIDLLAEYPGVFRDAGELAAMLPKLMPRLYSISSSPKAHAGEVHTTVAVVRYRSHNRDRGGVCSTLFADRREVGETLATYIQPNKRFRIPSDPGAPIIMIGPGTGVAPFRSFLHERRAVGAKGRNWLFFGDRSAKTDFLYREELEGMLGDGHLTRLDVAFSRDQERKIYVQDRMLEQAATFWSWLQDGASVYVCGDASRMAKDVDQMLETIVGQEGKLSPEGVSEYMAELKDQERYHRDVY
jgi:sulfite reductase (NADPH) flavoprotein alpha-component